MTELKYELLLPEFILAGTAAIVLMADTFRAELKVGRNLLPWLAMLGALAAGIVSFAYVDEQDSFGGLLRVDDFTTFFRVMFAATVLVVILGSHEYVSKNIKHQGEFYALLLLSTVGAIYMAAAQELLTAYISIELLSFSLYVLVSLNKDDLRSGESGLKYILLGGVASAMLLYGISLIYGTSGSTSYSEIATSFSNGTNDFSLAVLLGLVLTIAGLGFKASAVPFHMWTPDAYEGAPLPITAYLSATSKGAAFALLLRVFGGPLLPVADDWQWMIASIAVATMIVGNVVALQQSNIKRLLAYSSIGHVGYMMMAIVAIDSASAASLLLYIAGYLVTNLAVFTAVIAFYNRTGKEQISDLRGLAETQPYLALVIATGVFSLSGMPLLAGFVTKFILFQAAVEQGYTWLVVVAVVTSTISLYYYLQVIRHMYLYQPDGDASRWRLSNTGYAVTFILFIGMFVIGIWATPFLDAADQAAVALFAASS